jgi:hypothetical protein
MAYEETEVLVSKSQEGIRKMIYAHKGTGVSFVSQPPREGFEALVTLDKIGYHIRVMANAKSKYSEREKEQEERRVWRVLFWHLKAMFEAADSGVIAVEDIIMPYIVTPDGHTISEHIKPKLAELRNLTGDKLLTAGGLR